MTLRDAVIKYARDFSEKKAKVHSINNNVEKSECPVSVIFILYSKPSEFQFGSISRQGTWNSKHLQTLIGLLRISPSAWLINYQKYSGFHYHHNKWISFPDLTDFMK